MHPAFALLIAMTVATLIVGVMVMLSELRTAPEGVEDETGFWLLEDAETPDNGDASREDS